MEGRHMILKVGTVIYLRKEEDDDENEYRSRVIDFTDDAIMVDYPTNVETGKTAFFTDETALSATFTDDLKMSYYFQTTVKGRRLAEIPMLQLLYKGDDHLIKVQRREFVRVDVNLDVAVGFEADILRLVTSDISAGGLAVNLPSMDLLKEDSIVSLFIVLPFTQRETQYIRAKASVIRVFEKDQRYIASLEFVELSSADRQQVIQFCFERQLQMKNKMA